jgi:hypothetical protein
MFAVQPQQGAPARRAVHAAARERPLPRRPATPSVPPRAAGGEHPAAHLIRGAQVPGQERQVERSCPLRRCHVRPPAGSAKVCIQFVQALHSQRVPGVSRRLRRCRVRTAGGLRRLHQWALAASGRGVLCWTVSVRCACARLPAAWQDLQERAAGAACLGRGTRPRAGWRAGRPPAAAACRRLGCAAGAHLLALTAPTPRPRPATGEGARLCGLCRCTVAACSQAQGRKGGHHAWLPSSQRRPQLRLTPASRVRRSYLLWRCGSLRPASSPAASGRPPLHPCKRAAQQPALCSSAAQPGPRSPALQPAATPHMLGCGLNPAPSGVVADPSPNPTRRVMGALRDTAWAWASAAAAAAAAGTRDLPEGVRCEGGLHGEAAHRDRALQAGRHRWARSINDMCNLPQQVRVRRLGAAWCVSREQTTAVKGQRAGATRLAGCVTPYKA